MTKVPGVNYDVLINALLAGWMGVFFSHFLEEVYPQDWNN